MKLLKLGLLSGLCSLLFSACNSKQDIWIYASTYKEVLALYKPYLEKKFPDLNIQFYQAGSENVAAKILAELQGGGTKADLIMTSDLFFYMELKKQGHLLSYKSEAASRIPSNYIDADGMFTITRFPVMGIAMNKEKAGSLPAPKSFKDLTNPIYKNKITMPSPLESGTALTTILYIHNLYGDDWFKGLRSNEILSAGGNGATMSRIQSGEKPIGILLMENILQAKEKGKHSVEFITPEEGALAIPSPIAILKSTKHPEHAKKILDWFLSDEAQELLIKGWVYSPIPGAKTPAGAPSWETLKLHPWSLSLFAEWNEKKQKIKDTFQSTVLRE